MKEHRNEPNFLSSAVPSELPLALQHPEVFGSKCDHVLLRETHLSYLFFTEREVFKLKKPVLKPFVDLSTADARLFNARLEIALNRRLAQSVYYGLTKVTRNTEGQIILDGSGVVIDWLVHMRRLPHDRMLDVLAKSDSVETDDVDKLSSKLVTFYQLTRKSTLAPEAHLELLLRRLKIEHDLLLRTELDLPATLVESLISELENLLITDHRLFNARVCDARIVDGHGDLRPEHICLTDDCPIFDCLEFSPDLRILDSADELAYLTLELTYLGANEIGTAIRETYQAMSDDHIHPVVHSFYLSYRAMLRARLCLWHLYDCPPMEQKKWRHKALSYLTLASLELGKSR